MSLSAHDFFSRIHGLEDSNSKRTNTSKSEDGKDDTISDRACSEQYDDVALSSLDSASFMTFSDSISMDSAILQERGSLIALTPELAACMDTTGNWISSASVRSEDGERTILSSAPSGATIPAPVANLDAFAISPHPRFIPDGFDSLSTTRTDVLPLEHRWDDGKSPNGVIDNLKSVQSRKSAQLSPIVLTSRNAGVPAHLGVHGAEVFERVAQHLVRDSSSMDSSMRNWFNRFSDSDWDNFRMAAKAVLSALEPTAKYPPLLPLPPSPPQPALLRLGPSTGRGRQVAYRAQDHIPNDFVCAICKDAIVGARVMDCCCGSAIVCSLCWEQRNKSDGISQYLSDDMGFVWVEKFATICPHCESNVNSNVHCHALDVAILHIINEMPELDDGLRCLKENYYSRLVAWRATVYDLNEIRTQQIRAENEVLLARLIAEEECVFWEPESRGTHRKAQSDTSSILFLFSQAAVAVIVASVVSISLKAFSRR
jgi:hypothetical protein